MSLECLFKMIFNKIDVNGKLSVVVYIMDKKKNVFQELIMVLGSNILILLSSVLTGFVIPKLMGVENYSYYKTFTLYTSYTALFHFGFIDGILLKHGADDFTMLNRKLFRTNSQFFILFQLLLTVILMVVSLFLHESAYTFIFIMLAIYMLFSNITSYYQFISQATLRFRELSLRKVIQSSLTVIAVLILFMYGCIHSGYVVSFKTYIIITVIITATLTFWYIWTYRDITFGERNNFRESKRSLQTYFKNGIYLTVAYQVSTLVFTIDSQYISILFNKSTYAMYAFAYSLIQMILTVLNAVSTVLFPYIKRQTITAAMKFYPKAIEYILLVVYAAMLGYYPIAIFIHYFLPEYVGSLGYFQILFPGVGLTCCITLITFNYFKIIDKSKLYFRISIGVLVWSALINMIVYLIFKSSYAIAFAALVTLLIWHLGTELYLVKRYHIFWKKNFFYTLIMAIEFLLIVKINNLWISFGVYLFVYILLSIFFYRKTIKYFSRNLKWPIKLKL